MLAGFKLGQHLGQGIANPSVGATIRFVRLVITTPARGSAGAKVTGGMAGDQSIGDPNTVLAEPMAA